MSPFSGLEAWPFEGGFLGEFVEGLIFQVPEEGLLAFFPGLVQRAGSARTAGAVLHDAAGHTEGSFYGFYGIPKRYLVRGLRQP